MEKKLESIIQGLRKCGIMENLRPLIFARVVPKGCLVGLLFQDCAVECPLISSHHIQQDSSGRDCACEVDLGAYLGCWGMLLLRRHDPDPIWMDIRIFM